MKTGLIHLYIGDGKGKTTAAVGLAARAAGNGMKVVFGQILKGSITGEVASLEALGVKVIRSDKNMGFVWQMSDEQKEKFKAEQQRLIGEVKNKIESEPDTGLLVVDEVLDGISLGFIEEQQLMDIIETKQDGLEVVLTGHTAPEWLIEKADYVTEMKKIKHPYDRGVNARKSIEF